MSRFELPPEALSLIAQVKALPQTAEEYRQKAVDDFGELLKRVEEDLEEKVRSARAELQGAEDWLAKERAGFDKEKNALDAARQQLAKDREAFEELTRGAPGAASFIADAWADYESVSAELLAAELETKSHPAFTAAETVREKGRELAAARREAKLAAYVVAFYEHHFPWLSDLREVEEAPSFLQADEDQEDREDADGDPARKWLTAQEWKALGSAERSQRALDRYQSSRKTPWQLGRDYERYIGYLREVEGCAVTYQGIQKGLEDLGRDLIVEKDGAVEVVQCKRWAQSKTIHEKHLFQLYGTVVLARIEHPGTHVSGTFTTTTRLSETATKVAAYLGIRVEEHLPLADYPRIKCNVGRRGERIYHLPFDQQYDATLIEPERGELYVATAAEAEERGFRRAWRWHPAKDPTPR